MMKIPNREHHAKRDDNFWWRSIPTTTGACSGLDSQTQEEYAADTTRDFRPRKFLEKQNFQPLSVDRSQNSRQPPRSVEHLCS